MENLRIPRRALSTLKVEIKDDDSFGSSMELSDSTSVAPAEFSPELLMDNFLGKLTVNARLVENLNLGV